MRLGRVARPHGLRGEVVVREIALGARELAAVREIALVRDGPEPVARVTVAAARDFPPDLLVRFTGYDTLERAQELRGLWLEAERAHVPEAGSGTVYYYDLLDLEVVEESGRALGRVRRVLPTGAHEVLEVAGPDGELLVPYTPDVVLGWDAERRRLTVRLPEGLEEVYRRPGPGTP